MVGTLLGAAVGAAADCGVLPTKRLCAAATHVTCLVKQLLLEDQLRMHVTWLGLCARGGCVHRAHDAVAAGPLASVEVGEVTGVSWRCVNEPYKALTALGAAMQLVLLSTSALMPSLKAGAAEIELFHFNHAVRVYYALPSRYSLATRRGRKPAVAHKALRRSVCQLALALVIVPALAAALVVLVPAPAPAPSPTYFLYHACGMLPTILILMGAAPEFR